MLWRIKYIIAEQKVGLSTSMRGASQHVSHHRAFAGEVPHCPTNAHVVPRHQVGIHDSIFFQLKVWAPTFIAIAMLGVHNQKSIGPRSAKNCPVGPPGGSSASHTGVSAPSRAGLMPFHDDMSVATYLRKPNVPT